MLILTRRAGETLNIGDNVELTVIEVNDKQVRIGIKAPEAVKVWRGEIYQRIQREKAEANDKNN